MSKKIKSGFYNAILAVFFVFGCQSQRTTLDVHTGTLAEITTLNEIPEDELNFAIKMNRTGRSDDYFSAKLNFVDMNGYRIIYIDGQDGILIARNRQVIAKIEKTKSTIYKNLLGAPSLGFEAATVGPNYITYKGDKLTVEDFGYDGPDVIYETGEALNAKSFINNNSCKKLLTAAAGVACCVDVNGTLVGYKFSIETGWITSLSPTHRNACNRLIKSVSHQ